MAQGLRLHPCLERAALTSLKTPVPIVVCFALPGEAAPFRPFARKRADCRIVVSGMGPSNAERTARQALKQCQPSRLLTCGWAGGLNPQLSFGQVVYEADDDFNG